MIEIWQQSADVHFPHPLEPYPKLIINVSLTGILPTREQTPYVPITPDEIVMDAVDCYDAGAAIVHVHARDPQGKPTYDPAVFGEIIRGIRHERPDLIICATTSGRHYSEFDERAAVLNLDDCAKPDMASLTTGSLNFADGPSLNTPDMIVRLARRMKERGVKPELEIFDLGMVNSAKVLIQQGLAEPPYYFNILLGSIYSAPATMLNLCAVVNDLPARSVWCATGIGRFQLSVNVASILMGGHVRVGIEDSLFYDAAQTRLAKNRELVERLMRISVEFERPVATPTEARCMLGLGSGPAGTGDIVIDGARANDVPAMLELLKTANMHYIPSKEVPDFDWCAYFVARAGDQLVGLAGYKILSETEGKTTLMVVHPNARGHGTGLLLQAARLRAMACRGVRTVITNADRPDTIAWYKRHFGYMEIGRLKKIHEFGDPNIPEWTTLRMDLVAWVKRQETDYMEGLT